MTGATGQEPPRDTSDELVEYLVLTVPNRQSLESVATSLRDLAAAETVRILDVVVIERDETGSVDVLEIGDLEEMRSLGGTEKPAERLLSTHDIALVSPVVPYGHVALIVVTEDQWAAPLFQAVTFAGGRIVAGERIPAARMHATRGSAGRGQPDGGTTSF